MSAEKHGPRVVDNDRDEITVTLDGKEIRGWEYRDEAERRVKMLMAREFCEGLHMAGEHIAAAMEPTEPRPCDCDRCYCGNIGDALSVAAWDERAASAELARVFIKTGRAEQ